MGQALCKFSFCLGQGMSPGSCQINACVNKSMTEETNNCEPLLPSQILCTSYPGVFVTRDSNNNNSHYHCHSLH